MGRNGLCVIWIDVKSGYIIRLYETHLDCEGKNGIVEIEYMIEDPKYKYSCPWCRIEDQIRKPKFIMDKKHRKL